MYTHTHTERERERERERDRETDRQTDRRRQRDKERETEIETDREKRVRVTVIETPMHSSTAYNPVIEVSERCAGDLRSTPVSEPLCCFNIFSRPI